MTDTRVKKSKGKSCFDCREELYITSMIDKFMTERLEPYRKLYECLLHEFLTVVIENTRHIKRLDNTIVNLTENSETESETVRRIFLLEKRLGGKQFTRREREILEHLLNGKNNREISVELRIHEKTVKNHLWKIYRKARVNSRTKMLHALMFP